MASQKRESGKVVNLLANESLSVQVNETKNRWINLVEVKSCYFSLVMFTT
jgi:hypothetical protein